MQEEQEEKAPRHLRNHQIQDLYLEIQERIGVLERSAPKAHQGKLRRMSVELLRVKREWVGVMDELDNDRVLKELEEERPRGKRGTARTVPATR